LSIDIKVKVGSTEYTLSPGCTITRSVNKEIMVYPIEEGKAADLATLGRNESDTIRIDAVCSTENTSSDTTQPPYVDKFSIVNRLKEIKNTDQPDYVAWGSTTIYGRVKNITITQRPGEGNKYDLAITFEVGTCIGST